MAEGTDPESKTEEPTGKRLSEARSQGDVPKSMDLPQWASLAAVSGVVFMSGGWLAQNLMTSLEPFLAHPDAFTLQNNGALRGEAGHGRGPAGVRHRDGGVGRRGRGRQLR